MFVLANLTQIKAATICAHICALNETFRTYIRMYLKKTVLDGRKPMNTEITTWTILHSLT